MAQLFSMAARNNPKRSFLFVSKLLGKHIPINPHTSLLGGYALAALLCRHLQPEREGELAPVLQATMEGLTDPSRAAEVYRQLIAKRLRQPMPVKLLGFAETATALGHAMFDALEEQAAYLHTTRELLLDRESVLQFDEEHSHAVAHRCYAEQQDFLADDEVVVFVDDEMTTGKTTLNLIRDMQGKYSRKRYVVAALLDWRSAADEAAFAAMEQEFGISIETICLYRGTIEVEGAAFPDGAPQGLVQVFEGGEALADGAAGSVARKPLIEPFVQMHQLNGIFEEVLTVSADLANQRNDTPYIRETGRFGISASDRVKSEPAILAAAERLRAIRQQRVEASGAQLGSAAESVGEQATSGKTLVVGTGEFMYVPMRIAAELGEGVYYQSTTRSPIHPLQHADYAVRDGVSFPSPDDGQVKHFIYNLRAHTYDDVFIVLEREATAERLAPMLAAFRTLPCRAIHVVSCASRRFDRVEAIAYE
ncbi:phosphoribosyltransferase [Paenibacillus sp. MMS18-CY102]|nr:phosphoribosyltransferase [Paenibacillus sp. MMS18-CY102]